MKSKDGDATSLKYPHITSEYESVNVPGLCEYFCYNGCMCKLHAWNT
jgi:hypothetical protein